MLDQLDVLIGLALVLTAASMIVTLAVQAVASLFALRGSNLLWGVKVLLSELDPQKSLEKEAGAIAEAALRHPLVSDSIGSTRRWFEQRRGIGWFAKRWTLATAVRPEELIVVLQRLAAGSGGAIDPQLQAKLAQVANAGGLADLRLWFDSTMDRVSQRFTTHTRIATIAGSFLLAFVFRLDVVDLQSRLAAEPALRAALVAQAEQRVAQDRKTLEPEYVPRALESVLAKLPDAERAQHAKAAAQMQDEQGARTLLSNIAGADTERLTKLRGELDLALMRERGAALRSEAAHLADLCVIRWPGDTRCPSPPLDKHLAGIFASALLLCLGAPFWFNLMKSLVSLRPVVAQKTDGEAGR